MRDEPNALILVMAIEDLYVLRGVSTVEGAAGILGYKLEELFANRIAGIREEFFTYRLYSHVADRFDGSSNSLAPALSDAVHVQVFALHKTLSVFIARIMRVLLDHFTSMKPEPAMGPWSYSQLVLGREK